MLIVWPSIHATVLCSKGRIYFFYCVSSTNFAIIAIISDTLLRHMVKEPPQTVNESNDFTTEFAQQGTLSFQLIGYGPPMVSKNMFFNEALLCRCKSTSLSNISTPSLISVVVIVCDEQASKYIYISEPS